MLNEILCVLGLQGIPIFLKQHTRSHKYGRGMRKHTARLSGVLQTKNCILVCLALASSYAHIFICIINAHTSTFANERLHNRGIIIATLDMLFGDCF